MTRFTRILPHLLAGLTLAACGDGVTTRADVFLDTLALDTAEVSRPSGLPRVHAADPAAAARGAGLLGARWPGKGVIPKAAMRHLYLSWTTDLARIYGFYSDDTSYWAAFESRYGMRQNPPCPPSHLPSPS